jgi:hypothetical protein
LVTEALDSFELIIAKQKITDWAIEHVRVTSSVLEDLTGLRVHQLFGIKLEFRIKEPARLLAGRTSTAFSGLAPKLWRVPLALQQDGLESRSEVQDQI